MTSSVPISRDGMSVRPPSEREFKLFRDLIYGETGIHLSLLKNALLAGRLSKRIRQLGFGSFRDYYTYVTEGPDPTEKMHMLERICTHETHFFREPRQFEFLEREVFPEWNVLASSGRRSRSIRVWSAGCSTGQEPYSVAMLLLYHFPPESGWTVEIIATDISRPVLEQAKQGIYPAQKADEIPVTFRNLFMLKGVRGQIGMIKAGPEIRSVVSFQQLNLNNDSWPIAGPFDLIFCRNVLIYFDERSRKTVVDRQVDLVSPHGCLFLGHAETLNRVSDRLISVGPTAYGWRRPTPMTRNSGNPWRMNIMSASGFAKE